MALRVVAFLGLTFHLRNTPTCYEMHIASDASGSYKQETKILYSSQQKEFLSYLSNSQFLKNSFDTYISDDSCPVLNMKAYRGRRSIAPLIHNLGARLRLVVIIKIPMIKDSWEKTPIRIEYGAVWSSEPVWTFWRKQILFFMPGIEPRTIQTVGLVVKY
jgi:hypothetical protein